MFSFLSHPRFGFLSVLLALIIGFFTFLVLTGLTPLTPSRSVVLSLISLNGITVLALASSVGVRLFGLFRDRRKRVIGSNLYVQIVVLLSLCSALPTFVVAVFASVTLNRGLDTWFSQRTRNIVASAENVARAYLSEHGENIRGDVIFIAKDLEKQKELYEKDRLGFGRRIASYASLYGLSGVFIVNEPERRLEARAIANSTIVFHPPTPEMFAQARSGKLAMAGPGDGNVLRALIKLDGYTGIYLYVYRLVNPEVIQHLLKVRSERQEYSKFLSQRQNLQITFALVYSGLSMVFLLSAIWLGLRFAARLATPLVELLRASQRVSEGDFEAKVESTTSAGDLLTLTNTFNRMTTQLKSQREELIRAHTLSEGRRRFTETVLRGVRAGVIGLDESTRITLVNPSACVLLGVHLDQLLGKTLEYALPDFARVFSFSTLKQGAPLAMNAEIIIQKEGQDRIFLAQMTREINEHPSESGCGHVVTFDDITDLVSAQRTAAWADIARRIAHEIKNPLTPIQLAAERLRRKYTPEIKTDPEVFDMCTKTIIRQVEDIGRMVDEFSSFARMPEARLEPVSILEVIKESLVLFQESAPSVKFHLDFPAKSPILLLDKRLVGQALTNLLKNALEAIEARCAVTPSFEGRISLRVFQEGASLFVDISDNGVGFPVQNRARLKEPYVTTREKGTGLGLAIVNKIMEDHHGRLVLLDGVDVLSGSSGALARLEFPV